MINYYDDEEDLENNENEEKTENGHVDMQNYMHGASQSEDDETVGNGNVTSSGEGPSNEETKEDDDETSQSEGDSSENDEEGTPDSEEEDNNSEDGGENNSRKKGNNSRKNENNTKKPNSEKGNSGNTGNTNGASGGETSGSGTPGGGTPGSETAGGAPGSGTAGSTATGGTAGSTAGGTAGGTAGAAGGTAGGTAAGGAAAGGTAAGGAAAGGAAAGGAAAGGAAAGGAAAAGGGAALAAAAWPVVLALIIIIIIIIIILVLVGIIVFFMTVPGMVMDQLKNFAKDFGKKVASYWGEDSTAQIEQQEIYDVLNYLEEMGYDLKGYGFITKNVEPSTSRLKNYDVQTGVERDLENDNKIMNLDSDKLFFSEGEIEAHSDVIKLYIMSDNYVYTAKNFNLVTDNKSWDLFGIAGVVEAGFKHVAINLGFGDTDWGKGLISLHKEGGDIGKEGDMYDNSWIKNNKITINPETKTMEIKKGWGNNAFSFNLDGWTGRYGLPMDFLIPLHMATMKPDLVRRIITSFNTDVSIILKSIDTGNINAAYKNSTGGYVSLKTIEDTIESWGAADESTQTGNPFLNAWHAVKNAATEVVSFFDNLEFTAEEKKQLEEIGIDIGVETKFVYSGTEDEVEEEVVKNEAGKYGYYDEDDEFVEVDLIEVR